MGFRRKKKRKVVAQDFALQITSLADIFTILLVFLIKAFSSGSTTLTPQHDIILPMSHNSSKLNESEKMELAKDALIFNDQIVSHLLNFEFDPKDLEANGTPRALNQILLNLKKTLSEKKPLLILADHNAPYKSLKRILAATSAYGFDDYKLVVVEDK